MDQARFLFYCVGLAIWATCAWVSYRDFKAGQIRLDLLWPVMSRGDFPAVYWCLQIFRAVILLIILGALILLLASDASGKFQ